MADRPAKAEIFRDAAGEWRWRIRAQNGSILADSGEGYARQQGAMNGIQAAGFDLDKLGPAEVVEGDVTEEESLPDLKPPAPLQPPGGGNGDGSDG